MLTIGLAEQTFFAGCMSSRNLLLVPWTSMASSGKFSAGPMGPVWLVQENCSSSQETILTGSGNLLLLELVWDQTGCFKELAAGPWDQRD
ncbi:hypothetical protein JTB14_011230 [Gonioctena quinquepunctata]|nr:hypothetical protein JTB14_011230 [Gonioctena quinquepunctata]